MAWEWVAPVAVGVVGIAGTAGTVFVAMIGRWHAEELTRANAEVTIQLAREERRAATFVRAIRLMEGMATAHATGNDIKKSIAETPPQSEVNAVGAEISAYADLEMQETFVRWALALSRLLNSNRTSGPQKGVAEPVRELVALQAKFSTRVNTALSKDLIRSNRQTQIRT
jgi:hypothetical protein